MDLVQVAIIMIIRLRKGLTRFGQQIHNYRHKNEKYVVVKQEEIKNSLSMNWLCEV